MLGDKQQQETTNDTKCQLMVWGIPKMTKIRFKAACAKKGLTMKDALITVMNQYAKEA